MGEVEQLMAEVQAAVKSDAFNQEIALQILNNLKSLIFHQRQLKEQWDALASPTKVRSILGMIPEYSYIDKILSSKRHANPALTSGLHEID